MTPKLTAKISSSISLLDLAYCKNQFVNLTFGSRIALTHHRQTVITGLTDVKTYLN